MNAGENERLARVETEVAHIRRDQADANEKIDAMYEAFLQARGAKWVLITMWIGFGAMIANIKWLLSAIGVKFEG